MSNNRQSTINKSRLCGICGREIYDYSKCTTLNDALKLRTWHGNNCPECTFKDLNITIKKEVGSDGK